MSRINLSEDLWPHAVFLFLGAKGWEGGWDIQDGRRRRRRRGRGALECGGNNPIHNTRILYIILESYT